MIREEVIDMFNILVSTMSTCNDPALARALLAVKNILTLIQIVAPLVLIISASISLFQMMVSPDDKKKMSKIKNSFIAAAIIFFIPMLLNVVMSLVGDSTTFSDCWNNASSVSNSEPQYQDPNDNKNKNKVYTDPRDYQ